MHRASLARKLLQAWRMAPATCSAACAAADKLFRSGPCVLRGCGVHEVLAVMLPLTQSPRRNAPERACRIQDALMLEHPAAVCWLSSASDQPSPTSALIKLQVYDGLLTHPVCRARQASRLATAWQAWKSESQERACKEAAAQAVRDDVLRRKLRAVLDFWSRSAKDHKVCSKVQQQCSKAQVCDTAPLWLLDSKLAGSCASTSVGLQASSGR